MNIAEKYKGLTDSQVEESREKNGKNSVAPPERDSWWKMYLETFEDPIIRLLLIAIGLSMLIAGYKYFTEGHLEWYEPVGVMVAVFLATYIGFINTWKAMKQFDVLNQINGDILVTVVRSGNITQIPKTEVVVGDIVILETGMEVPADGEVLESTSFQINESKLTGESVSVTKISKAKGGDAENNKAYPSWKCLSSTNVEGGYSVMVVTEVGEKTEIGKTTKDALVENEDVSPLQKQLDKTAQAIGVVAFAVAGFLFTTLMIRGYITEEINTDLAENILLGTLILGGGIAMITVWMPIVYDFFELIGKEKERPNWLEEKRSIIKSMLAGMAIVAIGLIAVRIIDGNIAHLIINGGSFLKAVEVILSYFMIAVTLIVVAVPEGLPMATTMGLAYSMKKMLKQNVLVKRMMACEAIGAVTVICTDKTGTLTMNEMRVKDKEFGTPIDDFIYESIAVNSTANLDRSSNTVKAIGNPTEGAFLLFMEANKAEYGEFRTNFKIDSQLPFTTENKYMATAGISAVTGSRVMFIKGAPEKVIEFCENEIIGGKGNGEYDKQNINEDRKKEILEKITLFQNRGMRVIGFGYESTETCNVEKISQKVTWLGYIVIEDPPRSDVAEAIATCRKAGIDVKIITGDNPLTAAEIGNQVNIEEGKLEKEHLVTSTEYNELQGEKQIEKTLSLKVLARAKPQDKLTMVNILKANGHVVAMTGDGTNDAPAMNSSDCGIAMGKTGTSTAKEAADLILMDDSFSSIVTGVLWGRTIYLNIQRFILFQLTVNFTAILIAVLGPFIGVQLPLTVIQMLWVNLIMDTFAALALATEPPVKSIMENRPRNPKEFIITKSIAKNIVSVGTVFLIVLIAMIFIYKDSGEFDKTEKTIFFSTFIMLQFWNMFNARSYGNGGNVFTGLLKNRTFLSIAGVILAGQIIMVQFGGAVFGTVPLNAVEWIAIIGLTSFAVLLKEIVRVIQKKFTK